MSKKIDNGKAPVGGIAVIVITLALTITMGILIAYAVISTLPK